MTRPKRPRSAVAIDMFAFKLIIRQQKTALKVLIALTQVYHFTQLLSNLLSQHFPYAIVLCSKRPLGVIDILAAMAL